MKVVFIHNRRGVRKTLRLHGWTKIAVSLCLLGLPLSAGLFLGVQLSGGKIGFLVEQSADSLQEELLSQQSQHRQLSHNEQLAEQKMQALSVKLAEMQARLVRLDALGERLTTISDLDDGEFDFSQQPAQGGPEFSPIAFAPPQTDMALLVNELENQIDRNANQLNVLESLLVNRKLSDESNVSVMPVAKGWISSPFGQRIDPITGRKSWHKGIDVVAKANAEVLAAGSGVVTWSGRYRGFGNMVEIDHGKGFVSRYAHNQFNRVDVGDVVQGGDVIAIVGKTGRATGEHLHFEVFKNGRVVDPSLYIRKTLR